MSDTGKEIMTEYWTCSVILMLIHCDGSLHMKIGGMSSYALWKTIVKNVIKCTKHLRGTISFQRHQQIHFSDFTASV